MRHRKKRGMQYLNETEILRDFRLYIVKGQREFWIS